MGPKVKPLACPRCGRAPVFAKCLGPTRRPDRTYRVSGVFMQCPECLLASRTVRTTDAGKSDWRNVAARAWNYKVAASKPARAPGEGE